LKFNSEINIGTVVTTGAVLCSLIAWIVTGNNRTEQDARDLASVQSVLTAQISDLRIVVTSGLMDVHQQIMTLPDQRAKLDQDERRIGEIEARVTSTDQHLGILERSTIETRADVNTILRTGTSQPIMTKGGRP
jgi:hypothetical protein